MTQCWHALVYYHGKGSVSKVWVIFYLLKLQSSHNITPNDVHISDELSGSNPCYKVIPK